MRGLMALDSGVAYFPTDIGPTPTSDYGAGAIRYVSAPIRSDLVRVSGQRRSYLASIAKYTFRNWAIYRRNHSALTSDKYSGIALQRSSKRPGARRIKLEPIVFNR